MGDVEVTDRVISAVMSSTLHASRHSAIALGNKRNKIVVGCVATKVCFSSI